MNAQGMEELIAKWRKARYTNADSADEASYYNGMDAAREACADDLAAALALGSPSRPMELDNHHNALLCPYCNPKGLVLVERASAPRRQEKDRRKELAMAWPKPHDRITPRLRTKTGGASKSQPSPSSPSPVATRTGEPEALLERIDLNAMAIQDGLMVKANADDIRVAVAALSRLASGDAQDG